MRHPERAQSRRRPVAAGRRCTAAGVGEETGRRRPDGTEEEFISFNPLGHESRITFPHQILLFFLVIRVFPSAGNGTDTGQADYNAVPFSHGSSAGSDDPNNSSSYFLPSFPVPESLLNKLASSNNCSRNRQPPEKVHQIIARTALFVSEHRGRSEIVLRVKQGSNPTFGFLMPDHHLHTYIRSLVDHPQLLKDGADAGDTNNGYKTVVNSESEHAASSGGALSLLGAVYESGDEDEGMLPASSKNIDPGNVMVAHEQGHEGNKVGKGPTVAAVAATGVKDKPIFTKKNPMFTAI